MDLIAILISCAIIGCIPAAIASSKGRSFGEWWLYGALLFIVALIHSLCIKKDQKAIEDSLLSDGFAKCPYCAELVKKEALKCKHCGSDIGDELERIKNQKFSIKDIEHTTLFEKFNDAYILNDNAVKLMAESIKKNAKSTNPAYIFGEFQPDINYVKYLLPNSLHEQFIKRIKYWIKA
ncbi:zinc ribbon domain-containing protein [Serratia sp. IR-2025]|nr:MULTISPECIES: zinc ribbon domain-containing protein [Serratia]MBX9302606.1 zinc ribbon domain-containing protein [Serratia marcescens]MBX9309360.1 zinc ribbon domain-containing protein [Serratia marcescens]MBX9320240.1 zinc ribbon domain-containing protein [Serratia marcescens]MBX9332450.1 zinc ribbon domain-containing protein [Serratia marcescens]MBX9353724.1 zinc ribbon domain-containing protein [Serratia marcescens]